MLVKLNFGHLLAINSLVACDALSKNKISSVQRFLK